MKNPIIVIACILPVLYVATAGAFVENPCQKILVEGFYNEYLRSNSRLRDRAMYAELCSSSFQQARNVINRAQKSGIDGSLGFSYGLFSPSDVGAQSGMSPSGALFSEDRFSQWKSAYCSTHSSADSSRAAEFLMQKAVTESVANEWSACMRKREGLTCWAVPRGPQEEDILLNVNWTKNSASQPQVQHSFLSRGAAAKSEDTPARRILPIGYKLNAGTLQIPITKQTDNGIVANLTANHEGAEHSCNIFIPGERDFSLITPFAR
ncbi:MAG: hypothetical protein M3Q16_10290 [Pseudomonadota bacterium]|nr:hypothetical protein [Pseudomonadota bacterium]